MPGARYADLSLEEDQQLQQIENNPLLREKVRLRARVIRLSQRQMGARAIAQYTGRNYRSIRRDLERWEQRGVEGLSDGSAPGKKSPLNEVHRQWLQEKLADGVNHTASTLAAGLRERFGIRANRENVRVCLRELGYTWQRNRYVPVKEVNPEVLREHKASLETLKRGTRRSAGSRVSR
jgi:transposase